MVDAVLCANIRPANATRIGAHIQWDEMVTRRRYRPRVVGELFNQLRRKVGRLRRARIQRGQEQKQDKAHRKPR